MKNRFGVLALLAVTAAGAVACDDNFLTEVPSDFVAPENFYRNAGDALAAVNAAYASFITLPSPLSSSDYVGRNFWMVAEYPTEVVTSRLSAANERSLVDNYHTQFNSSHAYLEGIWQAAYAGINRANSVIDRVPGVPMDETRRNQIVAEAKFLRALHYHWLAGLFGGVPLKLSETQSIAGATIPRATAQETYAQIAKDLTEAATVLPPSWPGSDYGRATRGAALTLLGKAQLQYAANGGGGTAAYQAAEQAFRQVLTLGYSLDPNYASLFDGSNERSREIIFSFQNVRVDGYGGRITEWFSPITSPPIFAAGAQNQFQAERPFYDSYNANDVRKAATWLTSFVNAGRTITWSWTSTGCSPTSAPTCVVAVVNYGSTGPSPRKYLDLAAPDGGAEAPDYIILRYADVLLSLAEAINATAGPTGEAYGYVNQVRARANVPALTAGLGQAAFMDSLFLERRYEVALEMHGTFDNRRNWPWAKARIEGTMAQISTLNRSPFTSSVTKFNAIPIPDKYRLYPIPARACELNEALVQNPGWEDGICKDPGS
jgi:starch-binding outer membrane protein, SusD/RagB family